MNQLDCKDCMCIIQDDDSWLCGSPEVIHLGVPNRVIWNMDCCPEEASNPKKKETLKDRIETLRFECLTVEADDGDDLITIGEITNLALSIESDDIRKAALLAIQEIYNKEG